MQEYKVILTYEAMSDAADILIYLELIFGQAYADLFQEYLKLQIKQLSDPVLMRAYPRLNIVYRGYTIFKKVISSSILFFTILDDRKEIHILRILREERDWENILKQTTSYTYPNSDL